MHSAGRGVAAVAVGRIDEGVRRPGHRVRGELLGVEVVGLQVAVVVPEGVVLVPGGFVLRHPEPADLDLVARPFDQVAPGLGVGAAHRELAAGHPHHLERRRGIHLLRLRRVGVRVDDLDAERLRLLDVILTRRQLRGRRRVGLVVRRDRDREQRQRGAQYSGGDVSEWHVC